MNAMKVKLIVLEYTAFGMFYRTERHDSSQNPHVRRYNLATIVVAVVARVSVGDRSTVLWFQLYSVRGPHGCILP